MVDLTGILESIVTGVFSILVLVIPLMIQSHMKDKQAAVVLTAAVQNSLGAIKQALDTGITTAKPQFDVSHIAPDYVPGVQYVLDHAGDEAARFGITPDKIADKINAQVGLRKLAIEGPPTAVATPGVNPVQTVDLPSRTTKIGNNL